MQHSNTVKIIPPGRLDLAPLAVYQQIMDWRGARVRIYQHASTGERQIEIQGNPGGLHLMRELDQVAIGLRPCACGRSECPALAPSWWWDAFRAVLVERHRIEVVQELPPLDTPQGWRL